MSGENRKESSHLGAKDSVLRTRTRSEAAVKRRSLSAKLAEAVALCLVPLVLVACAMTGFEYVVLLSFVAVFAALIIFFVSFERDARNGMVSGPEAEQGLGHGKQEASLRRPFATLRLRDIMPVVVLASLAAAGRILFAPFPDFKPVSAIAIIAGIVFGRRSGFMVGALAALVSNFFFGQGAWTPWQMYAWGLIGYLAGLFAQAGAFKSAALPLYIYGFVSGLLYGFILNLWSIVGFYHPQNLAQFFLVYAAALPFDIIHGIATVVFLLILYASWHRKLERVKRKYGLR